MTQLAAMQDETPVHTRCRGTNAAGRRCEAPEALVVDGYCPAHGPGGADVMRERAALGGAASAAKLATQGFTAEELPEVRTLEDAKVALDVIRRAVLTRRITANEGTSAAKAIDSWVKTETAAITARLVNELRSELDAKQKEIDALRKQLAGPRLRAAK